MRANAKLPARLSRIAFVLASSSAMSINSRISIFAFNFNALKSSTNPALLFSSFRREDASGSSLPFSADRSEHENEDRIEITDAAGSVLRSLLFPRIVEPDAEAWLRIIFIEPIEFMMSFRKSRDGFSDWLLF